MVLQHCWGRDISTTCEPPTHRLVRRVICPPLHHPRECRPEPPLSARVSGGSVLFSSSGRHRSGVLNRARGRSAQRAFLPVICWTFRGCFSIGSPTPSASEARKHESPGAATSIHLRHRTKRCAGGSRRQYLSDALAEKD